MKFVEGLFAARSHFAFLVGLTIALGTMGALGATKGPATPAKAVDVVSALGTSSSDERVTTVFRPLDQKEKGWAETAWRYFENEYHPETGFVSSVRAYPSATLWDLGSYALGLISARDLDVIDEAKFDARMAALLVGLEKLELVEGILPNKAYNAVTGRMVDYENHDAPNGVGWSALDVARIGVPFTVVAWRFPKHTPAVKRLLARWRLSSLVAGGALVGARRTETGALERVQEGRLGYEQYAARSLVLLGHDASRSGRVDLDSEVVEVSGQKVLADARRSADHGGTHAGVLSEPYVLEAIELGFGAESASIATSILLAQKRRFEATGILTAVSEDNIDRAPYFVYSTVVDDRRPWAVYSPDGREALSARTFSTKAAMGLSYVFEGPYARRLRAGLDGLSDGNVGFFSGRYEEGARTNSAVTANTNGIVLEVLAFAKRGPVVRAAQTSAGAP